jgi:hypothetical protein
LSTSLLASSLLQEMPPTVETPVFKEGTIITFTIVIIIIFITRILLIRFTKVCDAGEIR